MNLVARAIRTFAFWIVIAATIVMAVQAHVANPETRVVLVGITVAPLLPPFALVVSIFGDINARGWWPAFTAACLLWAFVVGMISVAATEWLRRRR